MENMGYTRLSHEHVDLLYKPFIPHIANIPRRAPLIHRGYYIRLMAVKYITDHFLASVPKGLKKQIISIGCGYEMLFTRLKLSGQLEKDTIVIDIDLPDVISFKKKAIATNETLNAWAEEHGHLHILTCDLRDLDGLRNLLRSIPSFDFDAPTLVISECVLTYLPTKDSNAIMRWFADNFKYSMLSLYEQVFPNDGFGRQMLRHFEKKLAPIFAIYDYQTLQSQRKRMTQDIGFEKAEIVDMNEFWLRYLPKKERDYIEDLEWFDEYEEWNVKCRHYFIACAVNGPFEACFSSENLKREENNKCRLSAPLEQTPVKLRRWGHSANKLKDGRIVVFGGYGSPIGDQFSNTLVKRDDVGLIIDGKLSLLPVEGTKPSARLYHRAVVYGDFLYVFGGRQSPAKPYGDMWKFDSVNMKWSLATSASNAVAPEPRFNHSMTMVNFDGEAYLAVFGGVGVCSGKRSVYNDLWLFNLRSGAWKKSSIQPGLPCLHRHDAVCFNTDKLLVLGGLDDTNVPQSIAYVIDLTYGKVTSHFFKGFEGRYCHKLMSLEDDRVLVIGGVEILRQTPVDILCLNLESNNISRISIDQAGQDLLMLNHDVVVASKSEDELVIQVIGGGFTCFSMGSKFDADIYNVTLDLKKLPLWQQRTPISWIREAELIERVSSSLNSAEIAEKMKQGRPFVVEGCDLGRCLESWSFASYWHALASNGEVAGKVSVHVSNYNALSFGQDGKNYEYRVMEWQEFLEKLFCDDTDENVYLRSIGGNPRKQASDINDSFPRLAEDIVYPEFLCDVAGKQINKRLADNLELDTELEETHNRFFSSILRMSSRNLQLWTHYDVMDNALIQVSGEKFVTLFPPEQHRNLHIPRQMNSSTSPIRDIFYPFEDPFGFKKLHEVTSPYEAYPGFSKAVGAASIAILKPGDILFLPALWFHNVKTLETSSISVNVFWRGLDKPFYQKKDLYGNKDLIQAVEAEVLVNKAWDQVQTLPEPFKTFYAGKLLQ